MSLNITIKTAESLANITANEWNQFNHCKQPFISHEFLYGLERFACLGEHVGWLPQHLLAYNDHNKLIAAMPCYIKLNSFGEFVFDWQWASAYEQNGLAYYPKLVCAVPFSPVTGQRLLTTHAIMHDESLYKTLCTAFTAKLLALCEKNNYSSAHILFLTEQEKALFSTQAFHSRLAYQYHWHNQDYQNFDDFLSHFSSKKRRNVKRERRLALEINDIIIEQRYGNELDEHEWRTIYHCYQNTFKTKGNFPSLTLEFFIHLAQQIGKQIVIFVARQKHEIIAASICFQSQDTLYGRYWGCLQAFDCLHFELCFYQGIEYCIQHQLTCFEPGAQGEHKITRGFLPQETWSCHHIMHPAFNKAIDEYLHREKDHMQNQVLEHLEKLSPFK